jgi:hypothetical protein
MNKSRFSKAETRILEQYWKLGTCSVREILNSLPEEELHNRTDARLSCDESMIQTAHRGDLVSAAAKLANPEERFLLQARASSFLSHGLARLNAPSQRTCGAAKPTLTVVFGAVVCLPAFLEPWRIQPVAGWFGADLQEDV